MANTDKILLGLTKSDCILKISRNLIPAKMTFQVFHRVASQHDMTLFLDNEHCLSLIVYIGFSRSKESESRGII